ncbi:MAG: hypothetical protein R3D98_12070 [Candidatus Krumholzibacteriia bacterium]
MRIRIIVVGLLAGLIAASAAAAIDGPTRPVLVGRGDVMHEGGSLALARTEVDTVFLLGNPADPGQSPVHNGTFQTISGMPTWDGWTHRDATAPTGDPAPWQISEFQAISGSYSMWCGAEFDGDPGYGNNWYTAMMFTRQVADPSASTLVRWTCLVQHDLEPGYDYLYLQWNQGGNWVDLAEYDGARFRSFVAEVTYEPGQYVGEEGDAIQLRFLVVTDGIWSDEDGLWDTDGACQVDDVQVFVDGALVSDEDFEDSDSGDWSWSRTRTPAATSGYLYLNLQDEDPLPEHLTQGGVHRRRAWWCPDRRHREASPGATDQAATSSTTPAARPRRLYLQRSHQPRARGPGGRRRAPGVRRSPARGTRPVLDLGRDVPYWSVRSVDTGDPADLADAPASNNRRRCTAYRRSRTASPPRRRHGPGDPVRVACRLPVGWVGHDGTPAPYLDNVQLKAFPFAGPAITARTSDLFNDNFPEQGFIDPEDLASNHVRLDCAQNIAPSGSLANIPGDSIWVDVAVPRAGAVLVGPPRLYVRLLANPVFDATRVLPAGFIQQGPVISGSVAGAQTYQPGVPPVLIEGRYHFDLPDTGFFYPGDVLRYYLWAADDLGRATR